MPGVPERAGKGTTGELVKDLVFQVQDQFFEADRVRVQHRSGKPMDEMPEIMETDLVAGPTSPGPKCGDGDAGEVVQEDEMSEVVASEKDLKCVRLMSSLLSVATPSAQNE